MAGFVLEFPKISDVTDLEDKRVDKALEIISLFLEGGANVFESTCSLCIAKLEEEYNTVSPRRGVLKYLVEALTMFSSHFSLMSLCRTVIRKQVGEGTDYIDSKNSSYLV